MNAQQASDLTRLLDRVAARPAAFFGQPDILAAASFLSGFRTALCVALDLQWDIADVVAMERGWTPHHGPGVGIVRQMQAKGMSPEQVIGELVVIETEVLKRSIAPELASCVSHGLQSERTLS
jgi:hypothetical protein